MPSYRVPLSLALLCLWLCCASLAQNTAPCQPARYNNAYNTFKLKHIPAGAPATSVKATWKTFLNNNPNPRIRDHTVSVLKTTEENAVKAVCSPTGGKAYSNNLCISKRIFTFTTVRSTLLNNGKINQVTSVASETKHLILACDSVANQCLPVHFERNPYNDSPDPNARDCGV